MIYKEEYHYNPRYNTFSFMNLSETEFNLVWNCPENFQQIIIEDLGNKVFKYQYYSLYKNHFSKILNLKPSKQFT